MAFNKLYFSSLIYLILFELILLTNADNHSNSTDFTPTTIANLTNEEIVIEEINTTVSSVDVSENSTIVLTSTALETTEDSVTEANATTAVEEDQPTTTIAISTDVSTEKVSQTTIISLNADCQLTKYGCCADNITIRLGIYIYIFLLNVDLMFIYFSSNRS